MTETTPAPPTSSEFAEQMVAAGAKATVVTDEAIQGMLAQMNALQSQVDQLNAERGVPLDRVEGYLQQLKAHFQGRKSSAHHGVDFTPVETALAALPETSDTINSKATEAAHFAIAQWLKAHPGKELDYLETLASELHQTVLDREGSSGDVYKRMQTLEEQVAALLAATPNVTVPAKNG